MAWYTDLFCRVSFRGKTYNDIQDVCDDLDSINECMAVVEEEMCDMALSGTINGRVTNKSNIFFKLIFLQYY